MYMHDKSASSLLNQNKTKENWRIKIFKEQPREENSAYRSISAHQHGSLYLHISTTSTEVQIYFCMDNLGQKYFDYSSDCSDNLKKKILRLQLRGLRLAMLGGSLSCTHANYQQCSGARHHLAPECAEDHPQDLRFRRHQQCDDPNNARGLDNSFASDRGYDFTTATRLRHRRLRRVDHAALDKS
jgi:hypothetical protein